MIGSAGRSPRRAPQSIAVRQHDALDHAFSPESEKSRLDCFGRRRRVEIAEPSLDDATERVCRARMTGEIYSDPGSQ
jgi:hypothetical protein